MRLYLLFNENGLLQVKFIRWRNWENTLKNTEGP